MYTSITFEHFGLLRDKLKLLLGCTFDIDL
jgi:hypothetical protein